jgi:hypothetical protein
MEISDLNDIITDIIIYLEYFCVWFNQYASAFFIIFKYLFVIVLIGCGILTFLKARGIYFKSRVFPKEKTEIKTDPLTKPRLIIGTVYIVIGSGILFNYLIYFLIWILEPLPDRLFFNFIDLYGIDPYALNRIADINQAIYPHEKTIYYAIAMISFESTVHLILSIWYFFYKDNKNPRKTMINLFIAIPGCIIFGFTTFMPLIL